MADLPERDEEEGRGDGPGTSPSPFEAAGMGRAEDGRGPGNRLAKLQQLTVALSQTFHAGDLADVVLKRGMDAFGANAGVICLLSEDGSEFDIEAAHGYSQEGMAAWGRFPAGVPTPMGDAVRAKEFLLVGSGAELVARYPQLAARGGRVQPGALAVAPIVSNERAIGAMAFSFPIERRFSDEDASFMLAFADHYGSALERSRLFEAERDARAQAERAYERTTRLQEVTASLAEAVEPADVVDVLLNQGLAALGADAGVVLLPIRGGIELEIVGSVNYPDHLVAELKRMPADAPMPAAEAFRSGGPVWVESREEILARFPQLAPVVESLGSQAAGAVPLKVGGETVGVLGFQFREPRQFDVEDRELLVSIARQCAQALRRTQLVESERHTQARLRRLMDSTIIGTTLSDLERIVDANDAFLEMVGYTRQELEAGEMRWASITPPEFAPVDEDAVAQLLERGECVPYEKEVHGRDGSRVPILIGAALVESSPYRAVAFVLDLTERKAGEAERTRLLELERVARKEAERAREQLAFLAEASAMLFGSLNYRATLAKVARSAVPRLADWCVVDMLDREGKLEPLAVAHVDPSKVRLAEDIRQRYPPDPEAPYGSWAAIKTGRSQLLPEMPASLIQEAVKDKPEIADLIRDLGLRSSLVVPLKVGDQVLGAMTFVWAESNRRYTEDDLALAEDLARRAGTAIENSRRYEERRSVAETLQRSLLPPRLPDIPGIDIAARYRPAGDATLVGGDFYDVFETGEGRWGLVLGDVCGKGVEAAAITALARYTVRTAALGERRPSRILAVLNEAMLRQTDGEQFCTVCYARLRPHRSHHRLTVSSGGHPQPLVLRADGSLEAIPVRGNLLGVFPDPELSDQVVDLRPGDTVVLYTDGVTDEYRDGEEYGEERLAGVLRSSVGLPPAEIAERIVQSVEEFQPEDPQDDIAILVLRVTP